MNGLNLDPRYRAAAGLGARVVRANQEEYMRLAWEQIGDVLTVNHHIRRAQLATKASFSAYSRTVAALPAGARDGAHGTDLRQNTRQSGNAACARRREPRAVRRALAGAAQAVAAAWARGATPPAGIGAHRRHRARDRGVSAGTISAAPPRAPAGGATSKVSRARSRRRRGSAGCSRNWWGLAIVLLVVVIALVVAAPLLGLVAAIAAGVGVALAVAAVRRAQPAAGVVEMLSPAGFTPEAIATIPAVPSFSYTSTVEQTLPASSAPPVTPPLVTGDSVAAADMRRALIDFHTILAIRVDPPAVKPALDLALVRGKALAAIEPHRAMAARFGSLMRMGDRSVNEYTKSYVGLRRGLDLDTLREVMKYPDIKAPMYFPLDKLSSEYFVPNLKLIPNNTISLMKTNQPFIESYFVGLNHELARELLWREYPTDQQGSYFRQFWDVSNYVDTENRDAKTLTEDLKDIPPIHQWRRTQRLGSHNKRDAEGDASQVVLVIRGDLLKRYPNTFIYAQQARWGSDDRANRLVLSDETGELFGINKKDPRLRFPLYRARVAPDIHFIGFDLTLAEVRGDPRLDETAACARGGRSSEARLVLRPAGGGG